LVSDKAFQAGRVTTNITLSVGFAVPDGLSVAKPTTLLHRADLGLYKAKHNGRNRVEPLDEAEPLCPR